MDRLVLKLPPSQKSLFSPVFVGTSSFRKLTEKGYESISRTLGLWSLGFIFKTMSTSGRSSVNTYAYMPIEGRTADLPPSLKALKNVDISESGCSFHSILILIQDFPISENNLDQH